MNSAEKIHPSSVSSATSATNSRGAGIPRRPPRRFPDGHMLTAGIEDSPAPGTRSLRKAPPASEETKLLFRNGKGSLVICPSRNLRGLRKKLGLAVQRSRLDRSRRHQRMLRKGIEESFNDNCSRPHRRPFHRDNGRRLLDDPSESPARQWRTDQTPGLFGLSSSSAFFATSAVSKFAREVSRYW